MKQLVSFSIADQVATIQLNRPEAHNALNGEVAQKVSRIFEDLNHHPEVCVVILASTGKSFCAGADIAWMKKMARSSRRENLKDAGQLADMFRRIRDCGKPVIARVHGAALGGGVGLVAVSDVAVALESAKFAFSEIRLGLAPAVISPFLLEKIGAGPLRRYALTGEEFDAQEAKRIGLVSEVVNSIGPLDETISRFCEIFKRNGPHAMSVCKKLLREVSGQPEDWRHSLVTQRIVELRSSEEGQEGLRAFLEKRKPNWAG